jgi:FkbM family methyltransferase
VGTPETQIDELMRGIREELRQKRGQKVDLNVAPSVVEANTALDKSVIDEALIRADKVHAIGENLPPMTKQSGVRRLLAMITARSFLRIAQIITRDQRQFNYSLLVVLRAMHDRLRGLHNGQAAVEMQGVTRGEALEQRLAEMQGSATSRAEALEHRLAKAQRSVTGRAEALEQRLAEVQGSVTGRAEALEQRLAEVQGSVTDRVEALERRLAEVQGEAAKRLDRLERDFIRIQSSSYDFDDVTKPGHIVREETENAQPAAAKISYAQNREDILLARVFSHRKRGFYIDIGAHDPVNYSITKYFYDLGWHGINIEPSSDIFPRLCAARGRDINLNFGISDKDGTLDFYEATRGAGLSTFVKAEMERHRKGGFGFIERECKVTTLAKICEQYVHGQIDFVSIDVEGYEHEVIEGGDWRKWRPSILVVESTKPGTTIPSHDAWESLLLAADYVFANFDGLNRYYVRAEDKHLLPTLSVPVNVFDSYIPYEYLRQIEELSARIAAYERKD